MKTYWIEKRRLFRETKLNKISRIRDPIIEIIATGKVIQPMEIDGKIVVVKDPEKKTTRMIEEDLSVKRLITEKN